MNNRYGKGTTPKSLKVNDKEIYYVQSESRAQTKYRVNFEDGVCSCADFKNRGETCKHFYKVVMEKAIA
jgi:hypothetical protein